MLHQPILIVLVKKDLSLIKIGLSSKLKYIDNMFKVILKDADEILDFIIAISPSWVDEELLFDYFLGCSATLKMVDITSLRQGEDDHNLRSVWKENVYEKLPINTMPPLLVENGEVLDGNHRLRIAFKKGLKTVYIYDVEYV